VRCVAQLWDTEKRAKNVQDIADRGAALYDKFRGFAEDLQALGKDLDRAQASYAGAMSKLSDGRGSLVRQVELLRDLGVQPKRALPAELLERARGEEEASS
jgi:DNA recombination protein RmuC